MRFSFTGALLFVTPGENSRTSNASQPTVSWMVQGKAYTALARPGVSLRLWPPEGDLHEAHDDNGVDGNTGTADETVQARGAAASGSENGSAMLPTLASPQTSHRIQPGHAQGLNTPSSGHDNPSTLDPSLRSVEASMHMARGESDVGLKTIEITLIDPYGAFQVQSLQTLADHGISQYCDLDLASIPSLLFVGGNSTIGHQPSTGSSLPPPSSSRDNSTTPGSEDASVRSNLLDSFPSRLLSTLSPFIRAWTVAAPDLSLANPRGSSDDADSLESAWFRAGPLSNDPDWEFDDKDSAIAPTHIFVMIEDRCSVSGFGRDDSVSEADKSTPSGVTPSDDADFLDTYQGFLNLLKETHGKRTGDILVIQPFATWQPEKGCYAPSASSANLKAMVQRLSSAWQADDPLASGDFPSTPLMELAKFHLESQDPSPLRTHLLSQVAASPGAAATTTDSSKLASSPAVPLLKRDSANAINQAISSRTNVTHLSLESPSKRPSLLVRPSSVAAVLPSSRGTKARLHYIDTQGWLDAEEDTVHEGRYLSRSGSIKVARRLRSWLAENGFLRSE